MFCSRQFKNIMNKIDEQSLRISCKDQKTISQNLLERHNGLTVHLRNLQVLMTEINKIVNGVAQLIMNSLSLSLFNFELRTNEYNIRNFLSTLNWFQKNGKLWNRKSYIQSAIHYHLNIISFLLEFKVKIMKWKCDICPCRLYKKFQPNLGFVNPLSANPQNGQTHSNNSSALWRRIVWVCLTILLN